MASKGQKIIRFTDEERTKIVGKYPSGKYGYKILAKEYGISWKAVESMFRKYKRTSTTITKQEDYKERYEILKKYQAFLKAQRERK